MAAIVQSDRATAQVYDGSTTMSTSQPLCPPSFVVFEGVDGSGKTTLARALAAYYSRLALQAPLYADSFPGSMPGTLGEWVYRLHHSQLTEALSPDTIAPAALQLLHVAAHVDTILARMAPTFAQGGFVILDRYWWSTYSYSRMFLSPELVWPLIDAERSFLRYLPQPTIIYLTRYTSLKVQELAPDAHRQLDAYYREVIALEQQAQIRIHEIANDSPLDNTWRTLLHALELPYAPLEEHHC
jgi:thymidylate kinase